MEVVFNDIELKTLLPIDAIERGIDTWIKEEHFPNALESMDVTKGGISICFKDLHP